MTAPDGWHVVDLSVDRLHANTGGERARFPHPMAIGDGRAVLLDALGDAVREQLRLSGDGRSTGSIVDRYA